MSTESITNLMERASECVSYFEGKLPAQLIERDLEQEDYESLRYHVHAAEGLMAQSEMEANDAL